MHNKPTHIGRIASSARVLFMRKTNISLGACVALMLGTIIYTAYMLLSFLVRPAGDDFSATMQVQTSLPSFFHTFVTTLNSRYTGAIAQWAAYQHAALTVRILPFVTLSVILAAVYYFFKPLTESRTRLLIFTIAASLMLIITPQNPYHAYYWLSSFVTYGLPVILSLLLWTSVFRLKTRGRQPAWTYVVFSVFALLIGGLDEVVSILNIVLSAMLLTLFLFIKPKNKSIPRYVFILFLSFGLATTISYLLPATAYRMSADSQSHFPLSFIIDQAFAFAHGIYARKFCMAYFWMFIALSMTASLWLPRKLYDNYIARLTALQKFLAGVFLLLVPYTFAFVTACITLYSQSGSPPERTYLPFEFTLVIFTALFGLYVGRLLLNLKAQRNTLTHIYCWSFPVLYAGVLLSGVLIWKGLAVDITKRAILFDATERSIIHQVHDKNRAKICVPPLQIRKLPFPTEDPSHWVNNAIAQYYGAASTTSSKDCTPKL